MALRARRSSPAVSPTPPRRNRPRPTLALRAGSTLPATWTRIRLLGLRDGVWRFLIVAERARQRRPACKGRTPDGHEFDSERECAGGSEDLAGDGLRLRLHGRAARRIGGRRRR